MVRCRAAVAALLVYTYAGCPRFTGQPTRLAEPQLTGTGAHKAACRPGQAGGARRKHPGSFGPKGF